MAARARVTVVAVSDDEEFVRSEIIDILGREGFSVKVEEVEIGDLLELLSD